ncbi:unnamed protein product [Ostreobium quekettii]|uniref:Ion transport domain-containing protein n=1 Tax=Ostreobium quekettii TaxID=121088 RepID=A0A8S1IS96_9CHLO|nr:unnamed protein product [Ostreobium quekettii]
MMDKASYAGKSRSVHPCTSSAKLEKTAMAASGCTPLIDSPLSFYDDYRVISGLPVTLLELPGNTTQPVDDTEALSTARDSHADYADDDYEESRGLSMNKVLAWPTENDPAAIMCSAFSSDGTRIVTGFRCGSLCVWDAQLGNLIAAVTDEGHSDSVISCSFMEESNTVVVSIDKSFVCLRWDIENEQAPIKSECVRDHCAAGHIDVEDSYATIVQGGALMGVMWNTHWHYHLISEQKSMSSTKKIQKPVAVKQENLRTAFLDVFTMSGLDEDEDWPEQRVRLTVVWKPGQPSALRGVEFSDSGKGALAGVYGEKRSVPGSMVLWPNWNIPTKSFLLSGSMGSWSPDGALVVTWDPFLQAEKGAPEKYTGRCFVWKVRALEAQTQITQDSQKEDGQRAGHPLVELFPGHPEWSPRYRPSLREGGSYTMVGSADDDKRVLWARFIDASRVAVCSVGVDVEVVIWDVDSAGTPGCTVSLGVRPKMGLSLWGDKVAEGFQGVAMSPNRHWLALYVGTANKGYVVDLAQGLKVVDITLPKDLAEQRFIVFGGRDCRFAMFGTRNKNGLVWNSESLTAALHRQSSMAVFTLPQEVANSQSSKPLKSLQMNKANMMKKGSQSVPQPGGPIIELGFSPDENRLAVIRKHVSAMYVLDFKSGDTICLAETGVPRSQFRLFAFSQDSKRLATVMFDRRVLIWDLFVDVAVPSGIFSRKAELGVLKSASPDPAKGMVFSRDEQGNETVVVCEDNGSLVWLDTQKCLEVARFEMVGPKYCRACMFKPDGSMAAIIPGDKDVVIVIDLIDRSKQSRISSFDCPPDGLAPYPSNIAHDGSFAVVGWDAKSMKPVLQWPEAGKCSTEGLHRVAEHMAISGDNSWMVVDDVPTCFDGDFPQHWQMDNPNLRKTKLVIMRLFGAGERKGLETRAVRCPEKIAISPHGRRVACAGDGTRVVIWTPYARKGCIPEYHSLCCGDFLRREKSIASILRKHGPSVLNVPDANGMSFFMHAIVDKNVEFVRAALDYAEEQHTLVSLTLNPDEVAGIPIRSALEIAFEQHSTEIAKMVIRTMTSRVLSSTAMAKFLHKYLVPLGRAMPSLVVDAITADGMPTAIGVLHVPEDVFQHSSSVVATSNVFSTPVHSLQHLWGHLHKPTELTAGKFEVPTVAKVFPYPDCCQVGMRGLLRPLLVSKTIPDKVFDSKLVHAVVQYKWQTYAHRLFTRELCIYLVYVLLFTIYTILLGHKNREPEGFGDVIGDANGGFQAICVLLCSGLGFTNLFWKVNQIYTLLLDGQRHGFSGLWYWFSSGWNVLDLLSSMVTALVLPAVHFAATYEKLGEGESWLAAITLLVLWCRMLYFAQACRGIGPVVIMIFEVLKDLVIYMGLLAALVFGFATTFFISFRHDVSNEEIWESFGTFSRSLLTTFGMMLGEFNMPIFYETPSYVITLTIFVVYMTTMIIVLLNLLIALMTDTHDRVKGHQEVSSMKARAAVIDGIESSLSSCLGTKAKIECQISRFLHVIEPQEGSIELENKHTHWSGRIAELEQRFKRALDEKCGDMAATMKEIKNDIGGVDDMVRRQLAEAVTVLQERIEQRDVERNLK